MVKLAFLWNSSQLLVTDHFHKHLVKHRRKRLEILRLHINSKIIESLRGRGEEWERYPMK